MIIFLKSRGATSDDFSGQFFPIFEIILFCFVVAICDLVHAVEAMYDFPLVFMGITHISEKISRWC